jgi:hypothetical protein
MKYFLITLLTLFLITSCDNAKRYKTEISEIDAKQLELDSLEFIVNNVEIDSLKYMQVEASTNESVIRKYYSADTIDMAFASKLDKNKRVRKSLDGIENKKNNILNELFEIRIQFSNLKKDILAGLYDSEQIENYLNVEKLDVDQLALHVKSHNLLQEEQKKNFYYSNPQIKEYCEMLLKDIEK